MEIIPARKGPEGCILLFVKSPDHGTVKSRLAKVLGERTARRLYENFVLDCLTTLSHLAAGGRYVLTVCCYPEESVPDMARWLGDGYRYVPQQGADLGERMKNAFLSSFSEGHERVLLVGSDAPDLPGAMVEKGFHCLDNNGIVIGPAYDGGYYLIGFRSGAFLPAVFANISWSSDTVFTGTMAILEHNQREAAILPYWRDIDTLADLRDFLDRHRNSDFTRSHTVRYLLSHEETVKSFLSEVSR